MLVVAPGDKNHLVPEGTQPRYGAGGAGGDGVVVIPHLSQGSHQLDPVLHPAEVAGIASDDLVGHQAVQSRNSRHVVFQVVIAGQQNILHRQHLAAAVCVPQADNPVLQKHPHLQRLTPAEEGDLTGGAFRKAPGNVVVPV
ncbi:hypothetical protein SDC9_161705 [bioreactor metagenome]|uniref:Uncharacterized protein n=1 Tax=bioreactor metagenome TaxID=1076179 RepID=A0A645FJ02_9ZZZZ